MSLSGINTLVLDRNYSPVSVFPKLSTQKAEIALQGISRGAFVSILDYPLQVKTSNRHEIFWPSIIIPVRNNKFRPDWSNVRLTPASLFYRDHGCCQYCGTELSLSANGPSKLTMDHVTPESKGGLRTWENIAAACGPCNLKKKDLPPEKFGFPRNKPYRPTYYQLLANRSKYTVVVDDPRWMMFLPPWTGDVIVRKHLASEGLEEFIKKDSALITDIDPADAYQQDDIDG